MTRWRPSSLRFYPSLPRGRCIAPQWIEGRFRCRDRDQTGCDGACGRLVNLQTSCREAALSYERRASVEKAHREVVAGALSRQRTLRLSAASFWCLPPLSRLPPWPNEVLLTARSCCG